MLVCTHSKPPKQLIGNKYPGLDYRPKQRHFLSSMSLPYNFYSHFYQGCHKFSTIFSLLPCSPTTSSRGDWLLKFLYRTAHVKLSVAGLGPVMWENRRMYNLDLSSVVSARLYHKTFFYCLRSCQVWLFIVIFCGISFKGQCRCTFMSKSL